MTQENSSLFSRNAEQLLQELYPIRLKISFNAAIIDSFSVQINGKVETFLSREGTVYFAIESEKHHHYYILKISRNYDYTEIMEIYEWGVKPMHHFFGLQQAVEIGLFIQPQIKPNVLLCNDFLTTFSFLQIGVPAILVDPQRIWKDAYFQKVIRSTFSNIIVAYPVDTISAISLRKEGVKVFQLENLFKLNSSKRLNEYIFRLGSDDDFLQPLWELYEYIDDDTIIANGKQGSFSIIQS